MTHEKFIRIRGWFKTPEERAAAFDRLWKCEHGLLITEDEFLAEAQRQDNQARGVYKKLCQLVKDGKISNQDVYYYAFYKWCLNDVEAIVAYQTRRGWIVNNCCSEINIEVAKEKIYKEFGFDMKLIEVIEKSYYGSTDFNFIRFDCCGWHWLMYDGKIDLVYG